ncbi:hypothetical protein Vlu01_17020 [Micromonospora lutea]|uniref:Uncharacterized protein n=1 Tax=Micromonospora lutea TaxID=419825 RepID=A0ABQ4ITW9_9ACTN|nr:hypothetical protein Vlu01_17020 [Micromonospora lutea]
MGGHSDRGSALGGARGYAMYNRRAAPGIPQMGWLRSPPNRTINPISPSTCVYERADPDIRRNKPTDARPVPSMTGLSLKLFRHELADPRHR